MKKLLIEGMKVVFGLLAFYLAVGAGMWAWDKLRYPSVDDFCAALPDGAAPSYVKSEAARLGLPVMDSLDSRGRISVLNHRGIFFRKACIAEFKDGRLVSRRAIAAD